MNDMELKSFMEVLESNVAEIPPGTYNELIVSHNREMTALKDAVLDNTRKSLDEFVEKHKI